MLHAIQMVRKNIKDLLKTKLQQEVTQSRRFGEESRNVDQQMQIIYRTKLHVAAELLVRSYNYYYWFYFTIRNELMFWFCCMCLLPGTEGLRQKMDPSLSSTAGHPASCSGTGTRQQPAASAAAQTRFILVTTQLSTFLSHSLCSMQTSFRQE